MCLEKIDVDRKIEVDEVGWQVCERLHNGELRPAFTGGLKPEGQILTARTPLLDASQPAFRRYFGGIFLERISSYKSGFHVFNDKEAAIKLYRIILEDQKRTLARRERRNIIGCPFPLPDMGRLVIKKVYVQPDSVHTVGWQYGYEVLVADRIYIPPLPQRRRETVATAKRLAWEAVAECV